MLNMMILKILTIANACICICSCMIFNLDTKKRDDLQVKYKFTDDEMKAVCNKFSKNMHDIYNSCSSVKEIYTKNNIDKINDITKCVLTCIVNGNKVDKGIRFAKYETLCEVLTNHNTERCVKWLLRADVVRQMQKFIRNDIDLEKEVGEDELWFVICED